MKESTYLIGVFILGLSIIISAFILSNTSLKSASKEDDSPIVEVTPDVMTITQLAGYLQISEEAIESIILEDDSERAKLSSYDTYQYIPYLKIDDQKRFIKTEIDEWLKYENNHNFRF